MEFTLVHFEVPANEKWEVFDAIQNKKVAGSMTIESENKGVQPFSILLERNNEDCLSFLEEIKSRYAIREETIRFVTTRQAVHENIGGVFALHCALSANRLSKWRYKILKYIKEDTPTSVKLGSPVADFGDMTRTVLRLQFPEWYEEIKGMALSPSQLERIVEKVVYPFTLPQE